MAELDSQPLRSPTIMVLLAIAATQAGSALAKLLFQQVGPAGAVLLRVGLAAIVLLLLWRPRFQAKLRQQARVILGFGLALACMNFAFYSAIARIPIGVAVAVEFIGPLGLAAITSRRWRDGLWVLLAGTGISLLTPISGVTLDGLGLALALLAGFCWATYILLAARTGKLLPGGQGLAWAMTIGAVVLLPLGWGHLTQIGQEPGLLGLGLGVAVLSSVIPYSLELEALRSLPVSVFGILLSLEPVAGALAGWFLLGETLTWQAMLAIGLVTIAAAGSARSCSAESPDR